MVYVCWLSLNVKIYRQGAKHVQIFLYFQCYELLTQIFIHTTLKSEKRIWEQTIMATNRNFAFVGRWQRKELLFLATGTKNTAKYSVYNRIHAI